ncbi:hypothetical protein [Streptomyces sp. NPDC093149]|uniref:hypothetical protein n=1 Tax=Streptomyces sp. NPDC093149 TaxID=3366031 RepID=UPI00382EC501
MEEDTAWTRRTERVQARAIMTEGQPQIPDQPTQAMPPRPQVPPVVSAEQWSARFQQTHHREPTMAEYQAAVQDGLIALERLPRDQSMQQMADGAKRIANSE